MYPVTLKLNDMPVLVVGAGLVATRKVRDLARAGARLTVVAPTATAAIADMAAKGALAWHERPYAPGEVTGFALVLAATNDRAVNRQVYDDAVASRVWVNVADDPELCTFHLPAKVERGALQLAIGTGGKAPFAAKRLRQRFERSVGMDWSLWLDAAERFRQWVSTQPVPEREKYYDRFCDATLGRETQPLPLRVPSEAELQSWMTDAPTPMPALGRVALVGAGPGDPGLLTLRARAWLSRCDAVVYDRLALPALPCDLGPDVALFCVGKEAGHHLVPQDEINALLVRLAKEGKRVVRLKGGDPCVFGRGGEEALALAAAGVPFELVPGVTAGLAVPAYAGIPVTLRHDAVRLTLVTAHESGQVNPQVRWDLLAQDKAATLVGYMGVTALPEVVSQLVTHGLDPQTPAALIERGTTSAQRSVFAPLGALPAAAAQAGLRPPALFVIGRTVALAERLAWFCQRPLFGQRLAAFAPADDLMALLEPHGAELVVVPTPLTPAARLVLGALPLTGVIILNAEQAEALAAARDAFADAKIWCRDAATAEAATQRGLAPVDCLNQDPQAWVAQLKRKSGE